MHEGSINDEFHVEHIASLHVERMTEDEFVLTLDFTDGRQCVLSFVGTTIMARVVEA